jgi:hypothetical protein
MAQIVRDGESVDLELSLAQAQLDAMERPAGRRRSVLPWAFLIVGLLLIGGLGLHAYSAYATVARVNVNSKIDTPNPVVLFQDVATNGPRLGATVESSSRAAYTKALEQFVLDGTGLLAGLMLVVVGVFIRANQ